MNEHFLRIRAEEKADDWRREADSDARARISRTAPHAAGHSAWHRVRWLTTRRQSQASAPGAPPARPLELES
jgi:hypothetical protein